MTGEPVQLHFLSVSVYKDTYPILMGPGRPTEMCGVYQLVGGGGEGDRVRIFFAPLQRINMVHWSWVFSAAVSSFSPSETLAAM